MTSIILNRDEVIELYSNTTALGSKFVYQCHCAWLSGLRYFAAHDSQGQDTSLCMTPRTKIPHCAWLPKPRYLTVHDSPAKIPHCAWLSGQRYLTVHDSPAKIPHCAWLSGQKYLTVHDSPGQDTSLSLTRTTAESCTVIILAIGVMYNVHQSPTLLCSPVVWLVAYFSVFWSW